MNKICWAKIATGTAVTIGVATPCILGLIAIAKNSSLNKELDLVNGTLNIAQNENTELRQRYKELEEDKNIWISFGNNTAVINAGLTKQVEVLSADLDSEIAKNNQLEHKRRLCSEKGDKYYSKNYPWVINRYDFEKYCKE